MTDRDAADARTQNECPKCGGETTWLLYDAYRSGVVIATFVERCTACDWRGEPE